METAVQHSKIAIYLGIELASKTWKLVSLYGDRKREQTVPARDLEGFLAAVQRAKDVFGVPEDTEVRSCYEAGRDGFWVHRFLEKQGFVNVIIDPASVDVNRRKRRRKTDRIDALKLARLLRRHWRSDDTADWSVVRVPTPEQEDHRRIHRGLERLKKERTQHISRLKSLANLHGIKLKRALEDLHCLRDWEGKALPPASLAEMLDEQKRLALVEEQIADLTATRKERLHQPTCSAEEMAAKLINMRSIGLETAWLLSSEFFAWRDFASTKQVGSAAGLTGTPYNTGESEREQGISKAGSSRVRRVMIELAWGWMRLQPHSALTQWFNKRFAYGGKRSRRIGVVAVAHKLLVALWKYLQTGCVPEGAVVTPR
jgi:transposase